MVIFLAPSVVAIVISSVFPDASDATGRTEKTSPSSAGERSQDMPWAEVIGTEIEPSTGLPRVVRDRFTRIEMVLIPAGSFAMGSPESEPDRFEDEGPVRRVVISRSFYLGRHEVSQAEWTRVMNTNPSYFKGAELPVENVSWFDIQGVDGFFEKVNRSAGASDSRLHPLRLPTEAEWEYACGAGTIGPFSFDLPVTVAKANYDGSQSYLDGPVCEGRGRTVEVHSFEPNAWGLYQMHGNVAEWCRDTYEKFFYASQDALLPDPECRSDDEFRHKDRTVRGGSWYFFAWRMRTACRGHEKPSAQSSLLGFRVARTATP